MKIFCKIFGHKWDKSNKYKHYCKRCDVYSIAFSDVNGNVSWKLIDWDEIIRGLK